MDVGRRWRSTNVLFLQPTGHNTACEPIAHNNLVMQFKKYLPTREQLKSTRSLRFLGEMLFEPNLWHFNRHSVSYAVLIGAFCCFLPIPFQMVPGVLLAILIRCNVPITIAIVWISNPITMGPMMYFAYRLGLFMLGREISTRGIEFNVEWLLSQISEIWQPLLLGCFTCGLVMGITGFVAVRLYWRWKVSNYWYQRRKRNNLA